MVVVRTLAAAAAAARKLKIAACTPAAGVGWTAERTSVADRGPIAAGRISAAGRMATAVVGTLKAVDARSAGLACSLSVGRFLLGVKWRWMGWLFVELV